ncbi:MAG: PAS domain S-box protein [Sphingobacteriaceae bacterium]|nr:MAG: PAS domain S-box protein [Sphingobacteriaceae bacterium]
MSDDIYSLILEHGLAGVWDWHMDTGYYYMSPSLKAALGYSDDELENKLGALTSLMLPEDLEGVMNEIDRHIKLGAKEPFRTQPRYRHKDGSIIYINCTGMITDWGAEGKPRRMVGCHIDITKQKLSELKLKKTKELLNKTNLSVRLGGWEFDVINKKVAWTRVIKQILEVPLDYEPLPETRLNFYKAGEHRDKMMRLTAQAINTGEGFDTEVLLVTASGRELWVRAIGNAEFENGRCVKLFGTLQDINEQKVIQHELQKSEDRFRGAFENSTVGMALVSPEGKWLKMNQKLLDCFGYTAEELSNITFQEMTYPDDLEPDLVLLHRVLAGEIQNYQMEKRFFHKNGSIIWALLSVSLVRDNEGVPMHFVSHVQDITDKKEKEEQIKKTLDVVGRQNERLLNFAYIVSHNLRTHAGNFQSLIDLVNDPHTDTEERIHYLQLLQNVSAQLNETILNLNDVVSIQTNINLNKVPVKLSEYIDKTINVLTGEITAHNAVVHNKVSSEVEVKYHPAYLESILLNFLTNSIRYRSDKRRPEVSIHFDGEKQKGILSIADNGAGIDMDKYGANLFGMYKTFHGNSDARGIGLFITKSQIEAMGGQIEVHSVVDKGTTFKVHIV